MTASEDTRSLGGVIVLVLCGMRGLFVNELVLFVAVHTCRSICTGVSAHVPAPSMEYKLFGVGVKNRA